MRGLPFALFLAALCVIPFPVFADAGSTAITTVYIYDRPSVSVSLAYSDGSLICSWDIADRDENDTFSAQVEWLKDGEAVSSESVDCKELRRCAALDRPTPAVNEAWKCSVTVKDSYGAVGNGSAEFRLTPLSFFGGLLRSVLSFFGFG
ncbi:MAG: hypothetical protein QXD77_01610 [Candidatus Aenigmatarchaeota archaeon]